MQFKVVMNRRLLYKLQCDAEKLHFVSLAPHVNFAITNPNTHISQLTVQDGLGA